MFQSRSFKTVACRRQQATLSTSNGDITGGAEASAVVPGLTSAAGNAVAPLGLSWPWARRGLCWASRGSYFRPHIIVMGEL